MGSVAIEKGGAALRTGKEARAAGKQWRWTVAFMAVVLWHSVLLLSSLWSTPLGREERGVYSRTHPFAWFDWHLRRHHGPLVPSALALLRALIGPGGKAGKTVFRGAGLPGYWATAAVYLTAYAMRMGLYVLHAKGVLLRHLAALLPPSALAAMFPDAATSGHLMSDHLVLAASTGAQLVTELAVCVDALGWLHASKPSERGAGSERKLSRRRTALLVAVTAANAALLLLLLCDMAVTARFFHAPPETLVSFVVGWPFFYVVTSALL